MESKEAYVSLISTIKRRVLFVLGIVTKSLENTLLKEILIANVLV